MLRSLFIATIFFAATPILISVQWLLEKLGLPGWGFINCNYYRLLCRLLRIRVHVNGAPVRDRAVLFVSNHVSWIDIVVIGSVLPVAFVAKSNVRKWPLVGITAVMQRTVFVDRGRRHQAADAVAQIVDRLKGGTPVVLFAEGTSSDGNRVLAFRSALIGSARDALAEAEHTGRVWIQPLSIAYTRLHGLPLVRRDRPRVAWYGHMTLAPHFARIARDGGIDAIVTWGEPVAFDEQSDRKQIARALEIEVRQRTRQAMRGTA
jgi:1-acyl-sn-glycerol-3-phosphate acyltransferase